MFSKCRSFSGRMTYKVTYKGILIDKRMIFHWYRDTWDYPILKVDDEIGSSSKNNSRGSSRNSTNVDEWRTPDCISTVVSDVFFLYVSPDRLTSHKRWGYPAEKLFISKRNLKLLSLPLLMSIYCRLLKIR